MELLGFQPVGGRILEFKNVGVYDKMLKLFFTHYIT